METPQTKRRQPHERRGKVTPKFSFSIPADVALAVEAESDRAGITKAAVVVERLRESYASEAELTAASPVEATE